MNNCDGFIHRFFQGPSDPLPWKCQCGEKMAGYVRGRLTVSSTASGPTFDECLNKFTGWLAHELPPSQSGNPFLRHQLFDVRCVIDRDPGDEHRDTTERP